MGDYGRNCLHGSVKVEIQGHNIERFLNISSKRGLMIEQVEPSHFETSPEDFKKMKEVARKTGVHLKIIGRQGLPFFLYKNRKRKLLGIGGGVFFLILYISSFFIWDISFEGNQRFTDDTLFGFLETVPVYQGMSKSYISCETIEAGIRNAFSEITWVSAEIRGTRLIIRVKENEVLMEPEVPETTPCDLVAGKAGTITEIVIRSGVSTVKIGDSVAEGEQLVDGVVPIYDDAETLINCHTIHADAEIFAETVHSLETQIALSETEKTRTGIVRHGIYLQLLGRNFYLLLPSFSKTSWQMVTDQKQVHLLENFYLPLYYGTIKAYEYEEYERFYTEEEAAKIGEEYLQEYMEKLSEKGIQILGCDGKIEFNESGWIVTGMITVIENIAVESPIRENEENELVNECN